MGGKSFPGRAVVRLQQRESTKEAWRGRRESKDWNLEMDMEFWASRVQSAKHHSAMQSARHSAEAHLSVDDVEGDDDVCSYFPCPFCYMDIEVPVLRVHLQEEHCFDVKNSVCPVCAGNLGKDMIAHFTVQHSHLLKRRRKSQRTGFWSNSSASMLAKDLCELSSFLGVASSNGRSDSPDSAFDPHFLPHLNSIDPPDAKDSQDASSGINATVDAIVKEQTRELSTPNGAQEQANEELQHRAEFVQHMLFSTFI